MHRRVKIGEVRDKLAAADPRFTTLAAVANAFKHGELKRESYGPLNGLRAEHAHRGLGAAFSDGSYYSDGSSHSDAPLGVVMTMPDGEEVDLINLCEGISETIGAQFLTNEPVP